MSDIDHRANALRALELINATDGATAEISCASEAIAHALLAVEARLGELVEQQQLANVIAAFAAAGIEGDDLEMEAADFHAVMYHIRAHVGGIVNGPESGAQ